MNERNSPESYREDVTETVEKATHCGTRDLGYACYERLGCAGEPKFVLFAFSSKSRSVTSVEKIDG